MRGRPLTGSGAPAPSQYVYEFLLRFVVSNETDPKVVKRYITTDFLVKLLDLFDSEDPRERDYLKTILHRIYGKFMSHRSFIRKTISNVFYRFVYETERHNGIGELLEILGSIINGFAIPLKKEHLQFLQRALIPLHIPKCVTLYHQQLSYCIIQFVEKDADTAIPILKGLIRYWPWSSSSKQVLMMNELEEILELLGHEQLLQIRGELFSLLAKCLDSFHFQVAERTLFLWNNDQLVNSGCLSKSHTSILLPMIYGPLEKKSNNDGEGHWNATVEGLASNVMKMYTEYDLKAYSECQTKHAETEQMKKMERQSKDEKWAQIAKIAQESREKAASAAPAVSTL